jgi:hypothetical protein
MFENANSVLKVLVVLWDTYWSYPIEKNLREEHGGVLLYSFEPSNVHQRSGTRTCLQSSGSDQFDDLESIIGALIGTLVQSTFQCGFNVEHLIF